MAALGMNVLWASRMSWASPESGPREGFGSESGLELNEEAELGPREPESQGRGEWMEQAGVSEQRQDAGGLLRLQHFPSAPTRSQRLGSQGDGEHQAASGTLGRQTRDRMGLRAATGFPVCSRTEPRHRLDIMQRSQCLRV